MTLATTVRDTWFDGQRLHVVGTLVASGSYVTGGDSFSLKSGRIRSRRPPKYVHIKGANGFVYGWQAGPQDALKMLAFEAGAQGSALDQVAAGAYPAGIIADGIQYHAYFIIQ